MKYAFTLVIFSLLTLVTPALAATLYIDPSSYTLHRGDAVTVAVRLDVDEASGECINAVNGVIIYDENILPVDISLGSSIFPVWIEVPVIDKANRRITFAGGIPNGYCGRVEGDPRLTNTLLELVFRAPGLMVGGGEPASAAVVSFSSETTAYLNDGLGTKAELKTLTTRFSLLPTIGNEIQDAWGDQVEADTISPEAFSLSLERDEFAFENNYYIVFNTTDKQTGLSGYEVIEEAPEAANLFGFGAATAPWEKTRSPYVLKDQTLRSTVRVRALDKAGNEYIATLPPRETGYSVPVWWLAAAAATTTVLVLVIAVLFSFRIRKIRLKKPALTVEPVITNQEV